MEELVFSLDIRSIPVTINNKKYELQEPSGKAAKQFENAQLNAMRVEADGTRRIVDLANLAPLLVSLCLWDVDNQCFENIRVIEKWPNRILDKLFVEAKKLGGLDQVQVSISKLLKEALNHEQAPCSYDELCEWVENLHDIEGRFDNLKVFLRMEDDVKKR